MPGGPRRPIGRRYDLRWSGLLYVVTLVFVAVGAFNGQNNLLFIIFSAGVAGLIISGVISGSALMGLSLDREVIGQPRVGEPCTVRYRVVNRNGFVPVFALVIEESGEKVRARLAVPSVSLLHCPARGSVSVEAQTVPSRRGTATLGQVRIASSFPFGLFRKVLVFDIPERVVVLPARLDLADPGALLDRVSTGHERVGAKAGPGGEEFYGVREYVPGDPMRTIVWRRSVTGDQLVVRQNAAPSPPVAWIEIEHPGGPVEPWHAERAVALADAIHAALRAQRRSVGVWTDWAGVLTRPGYGHRAGELVSQLLAGVDFDAPPVMTPPRPRGQRITIKLGSHARERGTVATLTPERWLRRGAALPPQLKPVHAEPMPTRREPAA